MDVNGYICVMIQDGKTIAAVATGSGGAIAIIRLSGPEAFSLADRFFRPKNGIRPSDMDSFTVSYGDFVASDGEIVDDLLLIKFAAPRSYTGEDTVEFSSHASEYVKGRILEELIGAGARVAEPGEYTLRAYVNGKMDMVEAEAVADIIASDSRAGHTLATSQMRGGYTAEFALLRGELIDLQSLLELELDFGEEDVEFADRSRIMGLLDSIDGKVQTLMDSYSHGSAIKDGVPVAIIGAPNAGKSTLLNAMLNEERAIVSSIAGTTRDSIEETMRLGDVTFRFIDTAGLRDTDDPLEAIGIERARDKARNARVVLFLIDAQELVAESGGETGRMYGVLYHSLSGLLSGMELAEDVYVALLLNKCDKLDEPLSDETISELSAKLSSGDFATNYMTSEEVESASHYRQHEVSSNTPSGLYDSSAISNNLPERETDGTHSTDNGTPRHFIPKCDKTMVLSAKNKEGIEALKTYLASLFSGKVTTESVLITSARHLEQLARTHEALASARDSIKNNLPADLISADLRAALHHIGMLTGEITDQEVLNNIFGRFCIGK